MNSALQVQGRAASLEDAAPDGARLFIGEKGEFREARPLAYMAAIIWPEGVSRAGKMRLVRIPTKCEQKMNGRVKQAKILQCEEDLAAARPQLRTWISVATAISYLGKTAAKSCWNYTPKSEKRKLPQAFA